MMRGTLRWLPPDEGGRSPIRGTRYAATARLEAEPPSGDWSIVIDGITPGAVEAEVEEPRWLVWPNADVLGDPWHRPPSAGGTEDRRSTGSAPGEVRGRLTSTRLAP